MTAPATQGWKFSNGTAAPAAVDSQFDVRGFNPGQTWFLGFYYLGTRVSGTDTVTLTSKMRWWDSSNTELAATTAAVSFSSSLAGFTYYEAAHVAPVNAVRGRVNFTCSSSAATFGMDTTVTAVRLAKTQSGATVGAVWGSNISGVPTELTDGRIPIAIASGGGIQTAAIGDANRVRFSLFERGLTGWSDVDDVGITQTLSIALNGNYNAVKQVFSFTANSQQVALGNLTGIINIPVTPGERIFVSAVLGNNLPNVSGMAWYLNIGWLNSSGVEIGSRVTLASGTGPLTFPSLKGAFVTVPANAVGCFLRHELVNNTAGAASVTAYFSQPLVCGAGPSQIVWPPFNPGPSGDYGATLGADWGNNLTSRPANLSALGGTEPIQNSLAGIGNNLVVNSELTLIDPNYSTTYPLGFVSAYTGNNVPLPSFVDARVTLADGSYAFGRTGTGAISSGNVFDNLRGDYTSANATRFMIPCVPGDTIAMSALVAHQNCSGAYCDLQYMDEGFAYSGESSGSSAVFDIGAAPFTTISRNQMALTTWKVVIPPDGTGYLAGTKHVRWLSFNVRFLSNGTANPRGLVAAPFIAKVPAGQTAIPPYSPGPADRLATYGAYLGPGGNASGAVDANGRALADFSQSGHLNKNQDNIADGVNFKRIRGSALAGNVPLMLNGGKSAIINGSFASNMVGTALVTPMTVNGSPVSDGWQITGCDAAWQVMYEQSGSGTADVLLRLLSGVSIAAGGSQNVYVATTAPIPVRPGDIYYLDAVRSCANSIALAAGFTLTARAYVAWYYGAGGAAFATNQVTDVTGNSYGNTTTGTPVGNTVPAGAAYAQVAVQGIITNTNGTAGAAAASGTPGDIRFSAAHLTFASNLDSEVGDGATYYRMPAANMDSNRRGLIDFNSSHLNQGALSKKNNVNPGSSDVATIGSVYATIPGSSFGYTSGTTTVSITWVAMTLYRADGTTISISSGSISVTGLSNGTAYKVYPYVADSGGSSGTISFVSGGTGGGTPAICYNVSGDVVAASTMYGKSNIPMNPFQVATTTSGTGGGGGGGNLCLHPRTLLDNVIADELELGDHIRTPSGYAPIVKLERRVHSEWIVVYSHGEEIACVTPGHRFTRANGEEVLASELRLGTLLASAGDHVEITGLHLDTQPALLVSIELPPPHLYFMGPRDLVSHNVKP